MFLIVRCNHTLLFTFLYLSESSFLSFLRHEKSNHSSVVSASFVAKSLSLPSCLLLPDFIA